MTDLHRALELSTGTRSCRYPQDDGTGHCRWCGWPLDYVPARGEGPTFVTGYHRHRGTARPIGGDYPPQKGTELPLSEAGKPTPSESGKVGPQTVPSLAARSKPDGECIVWTGALFPGTGYGAVWQAGKVRKAHRVAWEQAYGPIPAGMLVIHSCDRRACIRLDHLRLGTHRDNTADMDARGRRGSDGRTKLSTEQVIEIRRLHREGRTQMAIAREFGVTNITVNRIVNGKTRTGAA